MDGTEGAGSGAGVELIGRGLVLEDASHGPQLCLGAVATSLPPQCGGPDIPNWDWDTVEGHTSRASATYGSYVVAGNYDQPANVFTLTRPPVSTDRYAGPSLGYETFDPDLRTPCPEPDGGWRVLDPATTTDDALQRTAARAARMPGYAGLWVDQSHSSNPEANDPNQLVLNVAFTGDPAHLQAREVELRATWGGALCVSQAAHTEAELTSIQHALTGQPGLLISAADATGGGVQVTVIYDDGTWQRELDRTYGRGVVTVTSALRPYDGQLDSAG